MSEHVPERLVDLRGLDGQGPVWGVAGEDLNATLLSWPADDGVAEHVNADREVLVVVIDGSGTMTLNDDRHELCPGSAALIPKGARRSFRAGPDGLRYVSVHLRRGGLQIEPLRDTPG